jgi:hypothetical protein
MMCDFFDNPAIKTAVEPAMPVKVVAKLSTTSLFLRPSSLSAESALARGWQIRRNGRSRVRLIGRTADVARVHARSSRRVLADPRP